MIERYLQKDIALKFFKSKAIILLGPRQTGKTTLIKKILEPYMSDSLILDGDNPIVRNLLENADLNRLNQIIGKNKIVFIDEAQRITNIGITSKIIVDQLPDIQLILSGSSSFELTQLMHEPLTGRKWAYNLWPISWQEWQMHVGFVDAHKDLENRLVFGFYPDVLNHSTEQERVLRELAESYLYKDVLMFGNIKKPKEIQKLLQALSFQIGSEVSYNELSEMSGLDPKTVNTYISILEDAFVIFRLPAFSRNLRNEIKKSRKIYFYDNGIRNAIIGQFQNFSIRNDIGALWENFLVSERLKYLHYNNIYSNTYFWRTTQQQEIDYLEEYNGKIDAYEFKLNPNKKPKFSKSFTNSYKSSTSVINKDNFREFLFPSSHTTT